MAATGAAWVAANSGGYWKYRRALADPAAAQRALLMEYVRLNADTDFGHRHGFSTIRSVADYQARVPLASYGDLAGSVGAIAEGRQGVLTREPVRALALSSGSAAAAKRIPYTRRLQREFRRAIAPWVVDLYCRHPRAAFGGAYWSITPALPHPAGPPGAVPVGFDDDSEYVGGLGKRLVEATLAVPGAVRFVQDIEAFRYVTLLYLLRRSDLSLISVWHPSFLTLLLGALPAHWRALLDDLARGTLTPPGRLSSTLAARLRCRPSPGRARDLQRLAPDDYTAIWPRLAVVSCWADSHAAMSAAEITRLLPGVVLQPKGLLATEGVVTLPFAGLTPLAVRSHFFEFLHESRACLAHELVAGRIYSVVFTTGGGLYRYRLEDRVEVNGFVGRTPSLRFLGKEDHVSDLRGEKLNETFVAGALAQAWTAAGIAPRYAFIAPDVVSSPPSYVLYVDTPGSVPAGLGVLVDDLLAANPHYRYCRALGQLAPLRVVRVSSMFHRYAARCREAGQRLGDIKPLALSARTGWTEVFTNNPINNSINNPINNPINNQITQSR